MLKGTISPVVVVRAELGNTKTMQLKIDSTGYISSRLNPKPKLTATVNSPGTMSGSLNASPQMSGKVAVSNQAEFYTGDYIVVPSKTATDLHTNNKLMRDDVHVTEIPYYETSNETGMTVYIGGS